MVSSESMSIMVSAGEASGDSHAAHALQALAETGQSFSSFGMGAGALESQGTQLIVDCRDLAVIGIVDVLLNYHKFLKRLRLLRKTMQARKPDLLLLVDYPDFNLKLAETAKSMGIPVLFYVSPQVWAWRSGRVPRIGSLVSHMAVLFPFEVDIYRNANIPVTYVGNPVVADATSQYSQQKAQELVGLLSNKPVVALLPGSRLGEIKRHLPIMIQSMHIMLAQQDSIQFILPIAPTLSASAIHEVLGELPVDKLLISQSDSRDIMRSADAALVASGTATLETALIGTPMVVMYVVNAINYAIMKRLIKIPDISLVNIVAGRRIVPEYLQHQAEPQALAEDVLSLLNNEQRRSEMLTELATVKQRMGDAGASTRVAALIQELANTPHD